MLFFSAFQYAENNVQKYSSQIGEFSPCLSRSYKHFIRKEWFISVSSGKNDSILKGYNTRDKFCYYECIT